MNSIRGSYRLVQHRCISVTNSFLRGSASGESFRILSAREKLKENLREIRRRQKPKTPCYLRLRRSEYKCLAYQEINPDPCLPVPCAKPLDEEAYKPSDKEDRNYQKTWCEFKPLPVKKPRMFRIYPEVERRDPKEFRGKLCTACEPEDCELPDTGRAAPPKLFPATTLPWPCCRLRVPNCRTSRSHVRCRRVTVPSCCVKKSVQIPSFSECKKFPLSPPITPCECDQKATLCDTWNYWRTKR